MQAVMLSIRPEWVELIARGIKTVEVRKTRPNMSTPFKCYIYCTKHAGGTLHAYGKPNKRINNGWYGKVIGELVCYNICPIAPSWGAVENFEETIYGSCLSLSEAMEYYHSKRNRAGDPYIYVWRIGGLKIYDQPKELSEFSKFGFFAMNWCKDVCINGDCEYYVPSNAFDCAPECKISGCQLRRPPQSWCYIAELDGEN